MGAILRKTRHENIIKLHDVFHAGTFACLVMDRCHGGDLITGMESHWKLLGRIPFEISARVIRQMAAAVTHLHKKSVIHRDIKGDNFLMSTCEICDPTMNLVLADFDTALEVGRDQRLHAWVGTKDYWAPELYATDYSLG